VAQDLAAAGYETFWPFTQERRRWADRIKIVDVPLYPGYVFVRMRDRAEDRHAVTGVKGVARILGADGNIEPIPDEEIAAVRRSLEAAAQAATETARAQATGRAKWQVIHVINRVSPAQQAA
jgi:transcription antitermination factor NusG